MRPNNSLLQFLSANFKTGAGKKILQISPGAGADLFFAATFLKFDIYGIDFSAKEISLLQHRYFEKYSKSPNFKTGDPKTLPWPDEFFDAIVYCPNVFRQGMTETKKIIYEAHRVLVPGGLFYYSGGSMSHLSPAEVKYWLSEFKFIQFNEESVIDRLEDVRIRVNYHLELKK